ncbi:MAG: hypothetical protein WB998_12885 [Solirubrobacteraceae bacterium]
MSRSDKKRTGSAGVDDTSAERNPQDRALIVVEWVNRRRDPVR